MAAGSDGSLQIITNLEANVGTTFPQLITAMDNDATYLSTLGEHVSSFEDLIGFELYRAEGFGTITSAITLGSFGFGNFSDADLKATKYDSAGDVLIMQDGTPTFFRPRPGSSSTRNRRSQRRRSATRSTRRGPDDYGQFTAGRFGAFAYDFLDGNRRCQRSRPWRVTTSMSP